MKCWINMIDDFWNSISDFETNERKNQSKNILLSEARAGARMEAYTKSFELYLKNSFKQTSNT